MTHRERLPAALNHRQPDWVPVDLGGTGVSARQIAKPVWGGPPGPRGSPRTRQAHADQGVGSGPGGPPHP